jgi:hypothetical protein
LFVQMLMSVLYFCFSFRFHHQKQKDLYNLLQYTVFYGLSGIQVVVHAIIHSFGVKKLAPCKNFSWLLNWLLTFKTGTWKWHWRFFWLLLFGSQSSPWESFIKCFSFRFHHQKQKDLYNLLQYTVFYGLSGIQPGFWDH